MTVTSTSDEVTALECGLAQGVIGRLYDERHALRVQNSELRRRLEAAESELSKREKMARKSLASSEDNPPKLIVTPVERKDASPAAKTTCQLFTINEATTYLGCSRPTIYELMRSGQLRYRQVGARRRFTREDLEAYIASTAVEQPAERR